MDETISLAGLSSWTELISIGFIFTDFKCIQSEETESISVKMLYKLQRQWQSVYFHIIYCQIDYSKIMCYQPAQHGVFRITFSEPQRYK